MNEITRHLKSRRLEQGLTLHEIAERTGLSIGIFQALESGEFARIGSRSLIRGYLKAYSQVLGIRFPFLDNEDEHEGSSEHLSYRESRPEFPPEGDIPLHAPPGGNVEPQFPPGGKAQPQFPPGGGAQPQFPPGGGAEGGVAENRRDRNEGIEEARKGSKSNEALREASQRGHTMWPVWIGLMMVVLALASYGVTRMELSRPPPDNGQRSWSLRPESASGVPDAGTELKRLSREPAVSPPPAAQTDDVHYRSATDNQSSPLIRADDQPSFPVDTDPRSSTAIESRNQPDPLAEPRARFPATIGIDDQLPLSVEANNPLPPPIEANDTLPSSAETDTALPSPVEANNPLPPPGETDGALPSPAGTDAAVPSSLEADSALHSPIEDMGAGDAGAASSEAAPAPDAGLHVFELEAVQECWIEVRVDGRRRAESALLKPGERRVWKAKETVRAVLGNAGGVRIWWDGRPLGPPGRPGEVLRLRFPGSMPDGVLKDG